MAICTPISASSCSASRDSPVVPIRSLSVSSICSACAGHPVSARIAATSATMPGSRTWRAARLTLTNSSAPGTSRRHCAACRQVCASTQRPSSTISPVSSASGMNRSGPSRSPDGRSQRTSASTPDHPLVAQPHQRLVDHRELAPGQRVRHPGRQREPADVAVVAVGVEHREPVAPVLLGPVERGVGGLHQLGRPGADVRAAAPRRRWPRPRCCGWRAGTAGARRTAPPARSAPARRRASPRRSARRARRTRRRPSGPAGAGRPRLASRSATAFSSSSPMSWPRVSLTALNPSRSR